MTSQQAQARIAMRDAYYNEHCWIQAAAMRAALDLLPGYPANKSLTVVDYGCAQGANAFEPMEKIVSSLPDGATANLFFEDTPWNDWSTLAKTVNKGIATLSKTGNVRIFPSLVPVGFYNQVIPFQTADVGLSWSSFNYLENQPDLKLDPTAPPAEFVAARQKAFGTAAHHDLIKLLKLRATEIRDGGYLVAAIGGQQPASDPRPTNTGFAPLQAALLKMMRNGRISGTELAQFALFPSHERTPEEIRAVLGVPEVVALWEVEVLESKLIVHPAWVAYQSALQAAADDDAKKEQAFQAYARATVMNLISSSGWFWLEILEKNRGHDWKGGEALLEELTQVAVQEVVENFKGMRVEIWYTYLKLNRRSGRV
ncbi:S-adenosyl-L-methionine-dependent methyltransferase [Ilyonectria robusta]|uniref:S-adenosyl-L-methionine-dependent methyltransferase n=1 Tax=Ilyonectria robusta TaxID=1079257 RepID=UPI001E8E0AA8|nr:S-adenosyl-L-methionine-dependent methyltransferase [Ilyonectria robusta]KAH8738473.1 S-adenosyl-L-methionine-dependent methyltransferase [Ilyonectria robusta]